MKAHVGVDANRGLAHTVVTEANTNVVAQAHALLHSDETQALSDESDIDVTKREERHARTVNSRVAIKPRKWRVHIVSKYPRATTFCLFGTGGSQGKIVSVVQPG